MSSSNSPRALARALTASVAALLSVGGCAQVGPNFTEPKITAAPGYAMAGDAVPVSVASLGGAGPAGQWWQAFGSPDLDRVIRQGLADSPSLVEADATLAQAQQTAAVARGLLGPDGSFSASVQETRVNLAAYGLDVFPNPTVSLYSVGGAVSYDIDLFGGRHRQAETAVARAQAEAYRAGAAYLSLTGNIALQAAQIASLRGQIDAAKAVLADDQTNIDLVRKALAAGSAPRAAQFGVRAQLAEDQSLLPPLYQQLAQSRHALAILVGRAPAEWTAPDFDLATLTAPASIPVELPSELARQRPDILAAEAELHAATALIGVQAAKLYPDITLNAGLAQTSLTPGKLFDYGFSGWNVGPGLTVPLFNRGALKAGQKQAEAAAKVAFARYQITVLQAFGQVADALQAIANDDEALKAISEQRADAEATLKNTRFGFSKGGSTQVDVTFAQRSLNRARRALAEAQGRRLADVVRLYMATGADWRSLKTTVAAR